MAELVRTMDGVALTLRRLDTGPASGSAPTFLLVHGFAQNATSFEDGGWPSALAERGAAVFMGELRGRGAAVAAAPRDWSLAHHLRRDLPALLEAVIHQSGSPRIHLLGHSMGGVLGYALLATEPERLASLTTLGAPLIPGRHRPLLRWAARVAALGLPARSPVVPMDLALRWARPLANQPVRSGLVRGRFRELVRLANPGVTDRARADRILGSAEAESARVLLDLAKLAGAERPNIDGVDLLDAVANARVPVAAVIGGRDVFCGPRCVEPLRSGAGPRRIVLLPEHAHVDLTLGNSVAQVLDELYPFLLA